MPTKWMPPMRRAQQLTVFNKGGSWSAAVETAIATFNSLGFGIKLVPERGDEKAANIVVKLSNGEESYPRYDDTIMVSFPAEQMHGRCHTLIHPRRKEIYFAGIFLPGKVENITPKQKEVIIVHELIHAAGLNGKLAGVADDPKGDHDSVGIMFPQMKVSGDGLIEYLADKGAQPMTPIRVGSQTMCNLRMLWTNESSCQAE
jgi:hypothetical protein